MTAIVQSISAHFDRSSETLWFAGSLLSGARFDVGFPIAHVAITFDQQMVELGYVAQPVCGDIPSINGFIEINTLGMAHNNPRTRQAYERGYRATMQALGHHAMHYASHGEQAVLGSIFSKIVKAVKSTVKTVAHAATAPARAAVNVTAAAVTGKNIGKAVASEVKSVVSDVRKIATTAQTVLSVVPGVGTLSSGAIGITLAGLSGKSLTEIVKAAGVSLIPGGALAQQVAKAGINTMQAAVEGKNVLTASAQATISAVASTIPDPSSRQIFEQVAADVASRKNVLTAAKRAALAKAVNAIPDPAVRDAARGLASGNYQSAADIAKALAFAAIPGGPVAQQLIKAGVNTIQAGIEGKNILSAIAQQTVSAAASAIADPNLRQLVERVALDAVAGRNVLTAAARASVDAAINMIPDPTAREIARQAVSGKLTASGVLSELTRSVVGKAVSPAAMGSLVSGSVDALTQLGTNGQASLKAAAGELIAVSQNFVPDANARATIQTAVASAMQGNRVGAVGPVGTALGKVFDPSARALLTSIVNGHTDPAQILKGADPTYVAKLVTLDPDSHIAQAIVAGQSTVSGPSGIKAPIRPKANAQSKAAATAAKAGSSGNATYAASMRARDAANAPSTKFCAIGARDLSNWRKSLRG